MKNSKLFKALTFVSLWLSLFLFVALEICLKVSDHNAQFILISIIGFFVVIPTNSAVMKKIYK